MENLAGKKLVCKSRGSRANFGSGVEQWIFYGFQNSIKAPLHHWPPHKIYIFKKDQFPTAINFPLISELPFFVPILQSIIPIADHRKFYACKNKLCNCNVITSMALNTDFSNLISDLRAIERHLRSKIEDNVAKWILLDLLDHKFPNGIFSLEFEISHGSWNCRRLTNTDGRRSQGPSETITKQLINS
jgi:hypothetical protein